MDKNTLGMYGWIMITLLCFSVLITFTTPLGEYAKDQIYDTAMYYTNSAFKEENNFIHKTPNATITGDVLTVETVEGATEYEIYNGHTLLTTLTTDMTVELSEYIKYNGTYLIKVIAKSSSGCSDTVTVGYKVEGLLDY